MGISALKSPDTGHQVGNAKGKANIPNHQFQSAFTTETLVTEAHAKPQLFPNITDIYFTENCILKLLSGLGPRKACGPDQPVLPRVVKELATQLAPILTDLLNRSYQLGSVSNYCRHANVSPVYKKVKQILAVNYRPISLICVCCKIFEHAIASTTMSHAQKHNILYAPQHCHVRHSLWNLSETFLKTCMMVIKPMSSSWTSARPLTRLATKDHSQSSKDMTLQPRLINDLVEQLDSRACCSQMMQLLTLLWTVRRMLWLSSMTWTFLWCGRGPGKWNSILINARSFVSSTKNLPTSSLRTTYSIVKH